MTTARACTDFSRGAVPEAEAVMGLLGADMVTGVDVVVDAGKHLMY